jgi:hypothetical protein
MSGNEQACGDLLRSSAAESTSRRQAPGWEAEGMRQISKASPIDTRKSLVEVESTRTSAERTRAAGPEGTNRAHSAGAGRDVRACGPA